MIPIYKSKNHKKEVCTCHYGINDCKKHPVQSQCEHFKIFCPTCGCLEVIDGEVAHPEMDKIYAAMIRNSFTVKSVCFSEIKE